MRAPAHLTAEETAIWHDTHELIVQMTPQKVDALEAYAIERARWLEAEAWIREHGTTIEIRSDKGVLKSLLPAPQLKIAQQAQDRAIKLRAQLGLRVS